MGEPTAVASIGLVALSAVASYINRALEHLQVLL